MAAAADGDVLSTVTVTSAEADAAAMFIADGITELGLAAGEVSYDILFELQQFLENEF
jgi:hypothetical protein